MNKGDLVELVATDLGGPRIHAEKAVRAVLDAVLEGVERDGSVTLAGFGTFERKHREARPGRNPRTGETLLIPASSTVTSSTILSSPSRISLSISSSSPSNDTPAPLLWYFQSTPSL